MANDESQRYLLQIELMGGADQDCRIRYALVEERPYPPAPRASRNTIDLYSFRRTLDEEENVMPDLARVAAQFPEQLGQVDALRNQAWVERVGAEWTRARLDAEMAAISELLFSGPGKRLLDELMSRSAAAEERGPWFTPRPAVTVSVQDPGLQRVPWELMNPGPRREQHLWLQCAILRRDRRPAGDHSVPFRFPLRVSVLKLAEAAQAYGWAGNLFDEFTENTGPLGAFAWDETPRDIYWDPLEAPVQHIVYSSGEGPDASSSFPGASKEASSLGHLLSVLERYGLARDPWLVPVTAEEPLRPPRLLVLHDIASCFSAHLASALVHAGLELGADAVLVASFEGVQAGEDQFFPTFYRKLMHNWPLEQGLLAAVQEANGLPGTLPTGWTFGAREGGELRLLLPRPVVEAVQSVRPAAEPAPPPKGPIVGVGRAARGSRQARALADLRAQAGGALERRWEELLEMAAHVHSGIPESEEHFVGDVVRLAESVYTASESQAWSREALDLLEKSQDRAIQEATVRLTNLWLSEERAGEERTVEAGEALAVQAPYTLHLLVAPRAIRGAIVEAFPEDALAELFKTEEWLTLDVALFSPGTDFELERQRAELRLPRVGASEEVRVGVKPRREGVCRLRACLYYGNVLLQSLLLEAEVVAAQAGRHVAAGVRSVLDYVANADLALLGELPQPDLSLFTNQVSDGTHWIGVYASDGETGLGLASGDTIALDPDVLDTMTREVRKLLGEIEGLREGRRSSYNYGKRLSELSAAELAWRERQLIRLACEGSRLFENLLIAANMEPSREDNLWAKLQRPGIISVARCRGERPSLPWTALYEQYLDTGREQEMRLCPFYQAELAQPGPGTDLLQDSQSCRERGNCPLDGDEWDLTVCPFGFWGFLHQVEQPLQDIDPLPVGAHDEAPEELGEARRNQTSRLVWERSGPLEVLMAVWPGFPDAEEHHDEIRTLFTELGLPEPGYLADREEILPHLQQGGKHLFYFFCHGEMQGAEFRLKLGPVASPGYISASNLSRRVARWPQVPQPLVILNGCETMALLAERIHLFATALRRLGACGVIGTEIEVFTGLARSFGRQVLGRFLAGDSLGEAFLCARKELMREGNPLGLAYTCLAPVSLHLHDEGQCAWCKEHGLEDA